MEGNLLRATKDGQRGNKGCLLVVLLCLQSMATERHTAVSLSCRSTSGARDCLECSGADSGLASLLGPTGFHYAGPGATRATAHRSVILLLSPQKTNVDVRRDLDHCVTVAIDRHPCGDTPQHPHDHRDHQHWQWCPRSQVDAGLTLGWSALVALVVVGAPPGTICLAPPLKPPRHRSHVLFVSLVTQTQRRATARREAPTEMSC